jgi:predicted permease
MIQTTTILNAIVPVFGIMGLGAFIRKLGWLTQEADKSLLHLCVNVLMPCLILDKSLGNLALSQPNNLLLAPLIGYAVVALGMMIAFCAEPFHGLHTAAEKRTFAVCVGIHNYSYLPLPLALLLFDQATAGVLFLHIIGVELAMWTLGVMMLSDNQGRPDWRKLLSMPLIAILLAILLNTLGWDAHMPQAVGTGIHWLGECAIPLALILIGAIIADHLGEFHSTDGWRVIFAAVVLRIGLLPLLFLIAAKFLPMTREHKQVLVLEAAMPSAVFPIVLARLYKGDPTTALRVVMSTAVVSLVTISLWIEFGIKFLGL